MAAALSRTLSDTHRRVIQEFATNEFWIGHANKDITDKYSEQLKDDVEYRRVWAEKGGLGFVVPRVPQSNVESTEQHVA